MTMKRAIIIATCLLVCSAFVTFVAIKAKTAHAQERPIVITDAVDAFEMSDIQLKGQNAQHEMNLLRDRLLALRHKYNVPDDYVEDGKPGGGAVTGWKPPDKKQ